MHEQNEQSPDARSLSGFVSENRHNLYAVGALAGVAAASTAADLTGARESLPSFIEVVETSGRHPMVGYIGAWAAASMIKNPMSKLKSWTAAAGAAVSNLSVEAGQTLSPWAIPEFAEFWTSRNLPETGKDAIFAAVGLGMYLLANRKKS